MTTRDLIFGGIIIVLIIALVFLLTRDSTSALKKEIDDLKKQNKELAKDVDRLNKEEEDAKNKANASEVKFNSASAQLEKTETSYDSLYHLYKSRKPIPDAQNTHASKLNDSSTVKLFDANVQRFSQSQNADSIKQP